MARILLMFALWSLWYFYFVSGQFQIPYARPENCRTDQYFQYSSLSCQNCGSSQRSSDDHLSCVCQTGYKLLTNYGGPNVVCENCNDAGAFNRTNSLDGLFCISCPNSVGFNIKTSTCNDCPEGSFAVDRDQDGSKLSTRSCVTCKGETSPSAATQSGTCKRCHSSFLSANETECSCIGDGVLISGGVCFQDTSLVPEKTNMFKVNYGDDSVTSFFFRDNFRAAQALCKENSNFTACQLLGNLCVLLSYDKSSDACQEYSKLVSTKGSDPNIGTVDQNTDWPTVMPWLFYTTNDPEAAVLDKKDITSRFQASGQIQFVLAVYTANGSFVGIESGLSSLQLCKDRPSKMAAASRFLTTYKLSCSLPVKELMTKPTLFYDLFIVVDGTQLYAIPSLVENIKDGDSRVNEDNDRQKWILTRRFYITDTIAGKTSVGDQPQYMHYAMKIELTIKLRSSDGEIFPPLLRIRYEPLNLNDEETLASSQEVSFSIVYEMDTEKIEDDTKIAVGCLSGVAALLALAKVTAWRRRHGSESGNFDGLSFLKFVMFLFSTISTMYFWIIFGLSVQWLVFFKQQGTVYRVLPTPSQERLFLDLFIVAIVFKFFDVLHMFWSQISVDIFFVDWERPHGRVNQPTQAGEAGVVDSPVSIWRTLFIANEWNEIQTIRKINPELQIILVLFFLKVVGFEFLATTDPQSSTSVDHTTDYVGEYSRMLRFAIVAIVFLAVECVQWFVFAFIYERFVADALGGFVDLCSMSNVSIFVLENTLYGFYIHGRSVHGSADTNMWQMNENLKREEDDLCGKRGLEPNSEQQTFEVEVPRRFREQYDQVIAPLRQRDQMRDRRNVPNNPAGPGGRTSRLAPSVERSLQAYGAMNRFLSAFIDHSLRDLDYLVRDKLLFEQILSMELKEVPPPDKAIFYNDNGRSFNTVLFYGNEWTLMLFELLFFAFIDLLATDYVLSGVLTYLFSKFLAIARDTLGSKNLARKTLVDERFLI